MTREEAIKELKTRYLTMSQCLDKEELHKANKALDIAIKALEQEPTDKKFTKADIDAIVKAINEGWELRVNEVLDKIRAEIIKYEGDCRLSVDEYPSCKQCTDNVFETIYAILDKYKAESENKE